MAGKPRLMVRLDPGVRQLLGWYAGARAIPDAELAAELVAQGVAAALGDADLRAALEGAAGPPPGVPLVALIARAGDGSPGISAALDDLRALGHELEGTHPTAAAAIGRTAVRVEGALVLLRDGLQKAQLRGRRVDQLDMPPVMPPLDYLNSSPERGIVTKEQ